VFCQGPYEESARYRDFMGWEMPWYSAPRDSLDKWCREAAYGLVDYPYEAEARRQNRCRSASAISNRASPRRD
jgi:predicted dithiol-disulfide oxidoreductase (DUF899 family)